MWPDVLDPDAVREIRAMKERAEEHHRAQGPRANASSSAGAAASATSSSRCSCCSSCTAAHDPTVRSPTTLDALARARGRWLRRARPTPTQLDDAYRFLRTVEHRLQLYDEQQTHTIPADPQSRRRLARVLGYRGDPDAQRARGVRSRPPCPPVHGAHDPRAPVLRAVARDPRRRRPALPEAAEERLAAFGFTDVERTRAAVRELAFGLTRRSKLMQQLLPVILEWLSTSPDPDLGLLQLRRLVEGPARSASLATTFRDAPGAAERACRLLGSSRVVGDALRRHPEFVDDLGDDDALGREKPRAELVADALETLGVAPRRRAPDARVSAASSGASCSASASRDLLGFAPLEVTERELTGLAEACLEAALSGDRRLRCRSRSSAWAASAARSSRTRPTSTCCSCTTATSRRRLRRRRARRRPSCVAEIGETTSEGQTFRIDARLRPEGNQGPLARSLDGYARYYDEWGLTWERQALVKARFVAGDPDVGRAFLRARRRRACTGARSPTTTRARSGG